MSGKSFLIDLTKCTACRGCQVACKQWHGLPAEETRNLGSHQNPQDLSFNTYKLVRFKEGIIDGKLNWLFFPEQCRHCIDPPCVLTSDVEGAMIHDEATGAVVYTAKTAEDDFETALDSCPYNIPRKQKDGNMFAKCDMCLDRVQNGMLPACVQTCPTGAMTFGDREDILAKADKALAEAKKKWPKATLVDKDDVRVIYLCAYDPKDYYEYVTADASPTDPLTRRSLFASLARPLKVFGG